MDRVFQPVKLATQLVLLAGFGGLLGLMAFAEIDSIGALRQIQGRNVEIRKRFVARNRALEQIRSCLYLSGTYTRDYLLDDDPAGQDAHREAIQQLHDRMSSVLASYARSLDPAEMPAFDSLAAQIAAYWKVLDPIFQWDRREKRLSADDFLKSKLLPRRNVTLQIADRIAEVNEQELNAGDEQLAEIFDRFRRRVVGVLILTLAAGLIVAAITIRHVVGMARDADARYREIVQAQGELKELSARLVEAQEQERRAISRELHDEVGQSLTALLMELGNLCATLPPQSDGLRPHVESIRKLAESSVSVVRNMALLLRPSMLDDLGLLPALEWQAREASKRTGIDVEVAAGEIADDLPEDHKTCIYRVVQEALHNAAQHAEAKSVRVEVTQDADRILLTVLDNGRGFNPERTRGLGLLGMEERVTHLGGAFRVTGEPGKGATISVELPLAGRTAEASA